MIAAAAVTAGAGDAMGEVDYLRDVKPLLRERCYACHGALKQESGLRLDTAAALLKGGESGPVVIPGDAATSLIVQRVATADPADRMPPEHEGEMFKVAEVDVLRSWIAGGAAGPDGESPEPDARDHWAFRPVVRPPVPVIDGAWGRHPIDAFVAQRHRDHGIAPQPEAPPEILVRRLHLDLTGLPPDAAALGAALDAPDSGWYEAAVDRLLADARHGERWARHWMDIWRYSDWWGLGDQLRNSQKHIWHWRDWIVESLNTDLAYDEMIRLMLAADELHPDDPSKLRATGFLARNYFLFNRNQWMDETVEHVGKALLGLTLNCAKCHDHKYDPVEQKDYYKMRAFFEPYHVRIDLVPGETDVERNGIPRVFDGWLEEPTWRYVRGDESRPDKSASLPPGVPALLEFRPLDVRPVALPPVAFEPERQPWVIEAHMAAAERGIESARKARDKAAEAVAHHEMKVAPLPVDAALQEPAAGGDGAATTIEGARAAIDLARARLAAAELGVASAEARRRGVEARGAALRSRWAGAPDAGEWREAAVRAEREAAAAAARHAVAENEVQHREAGADKVDEAAKALAAAREARDQAEAKLGEPVPPDASFSTLPGARWTPTRFRDSTVDDPDVPFPTRSTGRRTALAQWVADARNPLTARVAVNHVWARHMGAPLVATVFDFGRKAAEPTHPELLDWLAAEFIESGWSLKHLHRLIVTSSAYRLSSSLAGAPAAAGADPDNRLLWRRTPARLEAELVRDAIVTHTGEMDGTIGGPPVPPAEQETSKRRSLYFFHSNNERNVFLTTFDAAAVKECYRREESIVPQQALALSNSSLVLDAARKIADRLSQPAPGAPNPPHPPDDEAFIRRAWLELLAIRAGDAEVAQSRDALDRWRALDPADAGAARAHLIWALLNHNDFVTLR